MPLSFPNIWKTPGAGCIALDKYSHRGYNCDMITVGVRDLKNQISQYLQYVKDGEKVIITEHNRIIAEISAPQKEENLTTVEERLIKLSEKGDIILAKRKKSCVEMPEITGNVNWKAVYDEIRADRI